MRETLVVIGVGIVAVVAGVWLFSYDLIAPPAAVQPYVPTGAEVYYQEVAHGEHSTVAARKNYVVSSASELTELWKLIDAPGQPPTIDFKTESVLAIFAGAKSTEGYDIAVTSVRDGVSRMVTIALTNPGASCLLAQAETAPYQVIRVPKSGLALTHEDVVTTKGCLR